jgi:AraC-like DNA-binding protein
MNLEASLKEDSIFGTGLEPVSFLTFHSVNIPEYQNGFYVERHWHTQVEILYIEEGDFEIEINLETHVMHPGDFALINCEDLHKIAGLQKQTIHSALIFNAEILRSRYADQFENQVVFPYLKKEKSFPSLIHPGDPLYSDLLSIYKKIESICANKESDWYLQCKLLLFQWMNLFEKNRRFCSGSVERNEYEKQRIARYKNLMGYIEKNYNRPITLALLAKEANLNEQYLCRFFKELTGKTPIAYLLEYRLDKAAHLLVESTMSVLDISLECGFSNESYFIRKFKEEKKMTPYQYRKSFWNLSRNTV